MQEDDELTPLREQYPVEEQSQFITEDEDTERREREAVAEKLLVFGQWLAGRREEWVSARAAAGCDSRWSEDAAQFNGEERGQMPPSIIEVAEQGFGASRRAENIQPRSTVFVQVTRQKTNAGAARLGDILLPSDESNFSVAPTAVPDLPAWVRQTSDTKQSQGENPQGQPGQPGEQGAAPIAGSDSPDAEKARKIAEAGAVAREKAKAMQQAIEDCFGECDYNAEVRKVIFNAALFGTGVVKGPVVVNRTRKAWQESRDLTGKPMWTLDVVEQLSPASFSIDPRNVYPDPACGEFVQDGRGIFEVDELTAKRVRELAKQPAYMADQIELVLEQGPKPSKHRAASAKLRESASANDDLYQHWIYWGELEREQLEAAGVTLPEDALGTVSACVEMINDTVVRAYLNPLVDGSLPYDFFPWERVSGSVWGYGIPYLMRAQQRVINSAWRMILDNAGVSSGPQIVLKPGLITPADRSYVIGPRKIWYASDDVEDVRKAFTTFEFNTRQAELQAIIEMAEKLSDAETAVPMLAQGERGAAPETVGGMQMLMNSANVVLKRLVKQFDDMLTKPHVKRYYHYLMEYSTDEAIKGDYNVVALGSSSLVVRDIQNQSLANLLGLATNPAYSSLINLKKLFEKVLRSEHIDPADVMNSDDEIRRIQEEAAKNQQPDPRVAAAQFRADADKIRTQAQVEMNQRTLETKFEIAGQDRAMRLRELEMQRDIEMLRVSQKTDLTIAQIKAQLAAVAIQKRAAADQAAADQHYQSASEQAEPAQGEA